jgi:glycosyltransferase involved in cell wall biosynthesis
MRVTEEPLSPTPIVAHGHLLYLHGSTLTAYWRTGKVEYLEALSAGNLFGAVHMVNLDPEATQDMEKAVSGAGKTVGPPHDSFRFTAVGLARRGPGLLPKARSLRDAVERLSQPPAPALVLADDANLLGLTARWVATRWQVPYAICIYYDNDLHYRLTGRPALAFLRSRLLERALERWVLYGARGVYAGNRGYRDYGLRHGARPERTHLGSWSVDEIFYADPPARHPDGREILLVGRLHPLKFIDDVLTALTRLPSSVRLDVAGEGPDRTRLEGLVASLGLGPRVRFLGVVARDELVARMQGARALVVTQGFSAAVEALLSGRPVVAYDHECNAEVIRDRQTGLLVPFRDVGALAQALGRVLAVADLARELGQEGRRRMLDECAIARSIEHRRRFFEQCLSG